MTPLCLLIVPFLVHYVDTWPFLCTYYYRLFLFSSYKSNHISISSNRFRIFLMFALLTRV